MNCEEAIKLMDGYLDGELDPITSQTIEQHLRDCRNCEQAYDTHRALVRAIGSAVPRDRGTAHAECCARCSAGVPKKPARAADQSLGDTMELARSRRPRSRGRYHFRCDHHSELSASIAATRGRSILGHATHRQSCAFADGKSPHGRRFFRPAHRQTMVGRKARFRASGCRPFQRRISFSGWPSRLSR